MSISVRPSPASAEVIDVRVVTLEEHFTTPEFLAVTAPVTDALTSPPAVNAKLLDLDDGRISAMDAGGVDVQVLSLAAAGQELLAPADATAAVRDVNDTAFAATTRHDGRLRMFASLALKDPAAAAAELVRGVRELNCVGGFVNGTEGGSFLDDLRYAPLFEAAEELDVPIYLHPGPPPPAVRDVYFAGLPQQSAYFLATAAWGWHAELGLHCLRMILGGVFDRHPKLRMIVGHMGEDVPFSLLRAQDGLPPSVTGLERSVSEYFFDHFVITTSGYFTTPPFMCARDVLGPQRVLYSVDYPYRTTTAGAEFLQRLPIGPGELADLAGGNADRVLRLEQPQADAVTVTGV